MPATTHCWRGTINPLAANQTEEAKFKKQHRRYCQECNFRHFENKTIVSPDDIKTQHHEVKNNKCLKQKVGLAKLFCELQPEQMLKSCRPCYLEYNRYLCDRYNQPGTIPQQQSSRPGANPMRYVAEYAVPWQWHSKEYDVPGM
jgi:hypothetical protein